MVPLIPVVIMVVMKIAKKILDKYFQIYYGLADTFLEKLHGMTTLKLYQADGKAADDMDKEAERFRRVTMKVLSMQLNSTIVMDIISYLGAAIGIVLALVEFKNNNIGFGFDDVISIDSDKLANAFNMDIDENKIKEMTNNYMLEISNKITTDTNPAKEDWLIFSYWYEWNEGSRQNV